MHALVEAISGHFSPKTTLDCSSSEPHSSESQLVIELRLTPVWYLLFPLLLQWLTQLLLIW